MNNHDLLFYELYLSTKGAYIRLILSLWNLQILPLIFIEVFFLHYIFSAYLMYSWLELILSEVKKGFSSSKQQVSSN